MSLRHSSHYPRTPRALVEHRQQLRALTVFQPWATLIMAGAKPWEFRGWNFSTKSQWAWMVGREIVIHAASRPIRPAEVYDLLQRLDKGTTGLLPEIARPILERLVAHHRAGLELSAGLGTAVVGQPMRADQINPEVFAGLNDSDRATHANWGWPLTNINPWPHPVPAKGAQAFWIWRGDIPCTSTNAA